MGQPNHRGLDLDLDLDLDFKLGSTMPSWLVSTPVAILPKYGLSLLDSDMTRRALHLRFSLCSFQFAAIVSSIAIVGRVKGCT